jgi:hypothetical protein
MIGFFGRIKSFIFGSTDNPVPGFTVTAFLGTGARKLAGFFTGGREFDFSNKLVPYTGAAFSSTTLNVPVVTFCEIISSFLK